MLEGTLSPLGKFNFCFLCFKRLCKVTATYHQGGVGGVGVGEWNGEEDKEAQNLN